MFYRERTVCMLITAGSIFIAITQNCQISPYLDDCGNMGLLWNCSGSNLSRLPTSFPPELKNQNVTLDLSFNRFSFVTKDTFEQIASYSNVTSVILHHNDITEVGNLAFHALSNLCSLDLSSSNLEKNKFGTDAFLNISKLQILQIHKNNFQYQGYPDISLSRLHSLIRLKIDIFHRFSFSEAFQNLIKLSQLKFNILGEFSLTNLSFYGLTNSPIRSIDMDFKNRVNCDVTEDLFCSFPYLSDEIIINFGGKCNVSIALRSLKCLQNREIKNIFMYENKKTVATDIVNLDYWSTEFLINICVRALSLGSNEISIVKTNIYNTTLWNCLEYLDFSGNNMHIVDFTMVMTLLTLPKIRNMNLCCNNQPSGQNKFKYERLHIPKRGYTSINITLPKHLEVLDFSENYIHNVKRLVPQFEVTGEKLQELYLQKTNFPFGVARMLNFKSLLKLDLSENSFQRIHFNILQRAPNLRHFYALNVRLNETPSLISKSLFSNLKNLSTIDISENSLTSLPESLLKDQRQSLLEIKLDLNRFSVTPGFLMELENLEILLIRYNSISKFSERDQILFKSLKNISIYIEGNPISCACLNIRSLKWMKDHQYIFSDISKVLCVENKSSIVQLFNEQTWRKFELNCQTNELLIISVGLLALTILTITITAAIKKYRVHLEYVILRLKNRWKGITPQCRNEFLYDVYISYNDADYSWIIRILYPKLKVLNIKTWFGDKDSIPGRWESEEIVGCINESRKVMFIMSESFLERGWHSYAVQMAITHAFHNQRQGSIVVIIKDGLPLDRLPNEIKNIWWCIEHFRWPEDDNSDEYILSKLSSILGAD